MTGVIVVKLGSTLVTDGRGQARRSLLAARAAEIGALVRGGARVCVVSSGAIALGLPRLGLARRPRATPRLQAASAVGQARLQQAWDTALRAEGLEAAQILLSAADLAARPSYLNLRNAFETLLKLGVVPVVNENDATATDEITFGDNDALAAQVAVLLRARLLVLLTEVDGVYTAHPATPGAELVSEGDMTRGLTLGHGSPLGRGGMASKIAAARLSAAAGIPTVIASGRGPTVLGPIVAGEQRGTRFAAVPANANAFKLWLRYAKPTAGRIVVDEGARSALVANGRSLLAVGIVEAAGPFVPGDAVELVAVDGTVFGKGLASAASDELEGRPKGLEAVHRDRLVLYEATGAGEGSGGRVIAPSDAEETSAAYLASTPDV
ncbi:MAG: glutamate 5-kinase [Gaiellaceae bacterium]|jgi:glutamate 5-kinase|nr:glutamate 5-kinase [Gaiellaceae bacterium]